MSSPIYRIVTMYRIAWKNLKTGFIDYGDFIVSKKEVESSLKVLEKKVDYEHWIEVEDFDFTPQRPS